MKLILILIILFLFSCKKQEIKPCFLVEWEKVTTYPVGSDLRYDFPTGKEDRGVDLYCDKSEKSIQDILESFNFHNIDTAGVCITVHAVYRKTSNKK